MHESGFEPGGSNRTRQARGSGFSLLCAQWRFRLCPASGLAVCTCRLFHSLVAHNACVGHLFNRDFLVKAWRRYQNCTVKLSRKEKNSTEICIFLSKMNISDNTYLHLTNRSYLPSNTSLHLGFQTQNYCPLIPRRVVFPWHQGGVPCIRPSKACALASFFLSSTHHSLL